MHQCKRENEGEITIVTSANRNKRVKVSLTKVSHCSCPQTRSSLMASSGGNTESTGKQSKFPENVRCGSTGTRVPPNCHHDGTLARVKSDYQHCGSLDNKRLFFKIGQNDNHIPK